MKGIVQKSLHLGRRFFLHLHGILHPLSHGKSISQGILCHGQKQGGHPRFCRLFHRRISADDQIRPLAGRLSYQVFQALFQPLGQIIGPQIDTVELVKIGHVAEHVFKAHHRDHRPGFLDNLPGFHHQEGHFLSCQNDLHHRNVGVLLDQGGLQTSGNDDGSPIRDGPSSLRHRRLRTDDPHLLDGILLFLKNIVSLVKHLLSGYQKGDLSHFVPLLSQKRIPLTAYIRRILTFYLPS